MLTGLALLYVGAVLFLNGLWLYERIADREIILINLVVAAISTGVAIALAMGAGDISGIRAAAMTLLFAITYLWVAYNRITGCDGRGLGWFSLFVAITVVPVTLHGIAPATSILTLWLGISWGIWSGLWFMYFLLLAQERPIQKPTALVTLLSGIFTGWIPGLLLLFDVSF